MLIRLIAKWYSRVSQVFKLRVVTWVSWRRKLRTFQFRFRWLVTFSGGLCRDFESEEGGIEGLSLRFRAVKSPVNWRCYPNELETRKLPSRLRGLTYLNMFDLKLSLGVLSITIWGGGASFVCHLFFNWFILLGHVTCLHSRNKHSSCCWFLWWFISFGSFGATFWARKGVSILRILGISQKYTPMVHFSDPWI